MKLLLNLRFCAGKWWERFSSKYLYVISNCVNKFLFFIRIKLIYMNYFWKTKIIKILIKGNDFANKINLICAFCFFFYSDSAGGGDGAHTNLILFISIYCSLCPLFFGESVRFFLHSFQVVLFIAGIISVESSMVAFELVQTTSENNKNAEKKHEKEICVR